MWPAAPRRDSQAKIIGSRDAAPNAERRATILNAKTKFTIQPLGDSALVVDFSHDATGDTLWRIHSAVAYLEKVVPIGFVEAVPGFASLAIHYDPLRVNWPTMRQEIAAALEKVPTAKPRPGKTIELPVCYDAEFAPDLERIMQFSGMEAEAVIRLHAATTYTVQLIGFAPGFCYLAGLPQKLVTPRLPVPRLHVPAGSVGIGHDQTGVYPIDTPGGWNILGRTPRRLFRPECHPPTLAAPGDRLVIQRISRSEFADWRESS